MEVFVVNTLNIERPNLVVFVVVWCKCSWCIENDISYYIDINRNWIWTTIYGGDSKHDWIRTHNPFWIGNHGARTGAHNICRARGRPIILRNITHRDVIGLYGGFKPCDWVFRDGEVRRWVIGNGEQVVKEAVVNTTMNGGHDNR